VRALPHHHLCRTPWHEGLRLIKMLTDEVYLAIYIAVNPMQLREGCDETWVLLGIVAYVNRMLHHVVECAWRWLHGSNRRNQ
jgi:hypothetical protein